MDKVTMVSDSAEKTKAFGVALGRQMSGGEVVYLEGPLGAGKTTLTQGIAQGLGVRGIVASPSFVLERIHEGRLVLRHLDFYRLTADDVVEAGFFEDPPDDETVVVVEWAEQGGDIPEPHALIALSFLQGAPESRKIDILPTSHIWRDRVNDARKDAGL